MVKQMKSQYKVASPGLRPLWEEARRLALRLERFEIRHTLRGGNAEADRLANEAMDKGMGKLPDGLRSGPQQPRPLDPHARTAAGITKPQRQVIEGLVKNGVVHPIDGNLPEGILVKIIVE
jgi:probable phosphoglycerate mutase